MLFSWFHFVLKSGAPLLLLLSGTSKSSRVFAFPRLFVYRPLASRLRADHWFTEIYRNRPSLCAIITSTSRDFV